MSHETGSGISVAQLALQIEGERRDHASKQALFRTEQALCAQEGRDRIPPGYTKNDWPAARKKCLDALVRQPLKQFR